MAAIGELGKNVGDDFRDGKITLPVVLSFRRGSDSERVFWRRTLEDGDATDNDLETAVALMNKHRALEDTIKRARHYGSIAKDALALFPASPMKEALVEAVDFGSAGRATQHCPRNHQPDGALASQRHILCGAIDPNNPKRSCPSPTCAQQHPAGLEAGYIRNVPKLIADFQIVAAGGHSDPSEAAQA